MMECAERRDISLLEVADQCREMGEELEPRDMRTNDVPLSSNCSLLARDDDEVDSAGACDSGFSASDVAEVPSAAKRKVSLSA